MRYRVVAGNKNIKIYLKNVIKNNLQEGAKQNSKRAISFLLDIPPFYAYSNYNL